jgi:hypothetical protein
MLIVSILLAFFVVRTIRDTNDDIEPQVLVEDVAELPAGVAVPRVHHVASMSLEVMDNEKYKEASEFVERA